MQWPHLPQRAKLRARGRTCGSFLLMDNSTRAGSNTHTILVLSDPAEPELAMLDALPKETNLAVGNSTTAFERAAADADVIFNWSKGRDLLRAVFAMTPEVRWVH